MGTHVSACVHTQPARVGPFAPFQRPLELSDSNHSAYKLGRAEKTYGKPLKTFGPSIVQSHPGSNKSRISIAAAVTKRSMIKGK